MTLITPGGAIPAPTRQNIVGQGVVSAAGVCVITFNPPPMGYTLTGAVSVYDSPTAASWQIALSGTIIDITSGASSVGNIQIQGADVLTLTASNLLPFAGQTFHANFIALSQQDEYSTPIIPSHDSLVLPSTYDSTVLVNKQVVNGNGSGTANFVVSGLSIATKYLKIYWTSTSIIDTSVVITGNTTGIIYSTIPFIQTFGPITAPQGGIIDAYVESALDTAVTISFPQLNVGQAITVWVAGSPISPLAHLDDGQVANMTDVNHWTADTPATAIPSAANTNAVLIPNPPTGTLYRMGTLTVAQGSNTAGSFQLSGIGSGTVYLVTGLPSTDNGTNVIPFDVQLSEGLNCQATVSPVRFTTYYRSLKAT